MFFKTRLLIAFSCLFIFMTGFLYAQTPKELRIGTWVPGRIGEGEEQWFSVRVPGTAADGGQWYNTRSSQPSLLVVETSGDLDTYLKAFDASRVLIAENDDGNDNYNAKLEIFVEAGKTYLFRLTEYDDSAGSYQIRATHTSLTSKELRFGSWVPGNLGRGEEQWFNVKASQAGLLIVETSGNTDTCLRAYSGSGSFLREDDDGGDDGNARIELFTEAGASYYFKLSGYDGEAGSYQIRSGFESIPSDAERNTERSRATPIKLGEAATVYFRVPAESMWYRYDIPRDGTVFVIQTRGNLDTTLTLYNSSGNEIDEDDDSGEGSNAMISRRLNSGTVYVKVSDLDEGVGRCTLHAEIR